MSNLNILNPQNSSALYIRVQSTDHEWRHTWIMPTTFSFATLTEEDLAECLEAHYNGDLNLADYFSVGDTHTASDANPLFQIASHTASRTYTGSWQTSPTCPKQTTIKWVIIGLNHDNFVNSINGISKAAITIQTLGVIWGDAINVSNEWYPSMNDWQDNSGGWSAMPLRAYANGNFKNACGFKDYIKIVKKPICSTYSSNSIIQVEDSVFLLSYGEVCGGFHYYYKPNAYEGTQYSYFPTNTYDTTHTVKHVGWEGLSGTSAVQWWLRSCGTAGGYYFMYAGISGDPSVKNANDTGICFAPAACL